MNHTSITLSKCVHTCDHTFFRAWVLQTGAHQANVKMFRFLIKKLAQKAVQKCS